MKEKSLAERQAHTNVFVNDGRASVGKEYYVVEKQYCENNIELLLRTSSNDEIKLNQFLVNRVGDFGMYNNYLQVNI